MARGRKPKDFVPPPPVEIDEAQVQTESQALTTITAADELAFRQKRANVRSGVVQTALFLRSIGDVLVAKNIEDARQSKDYVDLLYADEAGNLRRIRNFEEYCQVEFGLSYARCMELSGNLRLLGPSLYEQSEKLGLRQIDYRALRALPADDQVLVKRAIEEAQDREAVLDILQELAAKTQREREEREAKVQELEADAEANAKFLEDKNRRIDTLERELQRHERGVVPVDQTCVKIMEELHTHGREADLQLRNLAVILHAIDVIADEDAEKPHSERDKRAVLLLVQRMRDQLRRIALSVGEMQHEFEDLLSGILGGHEIDPLRLPDDGKR